MPTTVHPASLLHLIVDLMRLRAGPQDLPHSPPLLVRFALVALAVDLFSAHVLDVDGTPAPRFMVAFALTFALPWMLLSWRNRRERYVQTMLALLATGIAFSLLFLPLASWALTQGLIGVDTAPDPQQALFAWLILALVVWKVAVTASIWRHALDWPLPAGVGISLLLFVAEFGLDRLLFAGTAG
ncbi:hypothetical protein OS187_04615 [Xanthomonadaceae bacterium JHOS43]|nr:hypothetical protein [Xanthomonadaceae bacterium JHOS43]MCX7562215.1 hypothetical protein [Xanthomonadaceae bacterium XH05]